MEPLRGALRWVVLVVVIVLVIALLLAGGDDEAHSMARLLTADRAAQLLLGRGGSATS